MATPPLSAESLAASHETIRHLPNDRAPVPASGPMRKRHMLRKYRIQSLRNDGSVHDTENLGPAIPAFEAAFSAFARGTLIKTAQGPVAIEDLIPGTKIITAEYGPMPLLWVGSMTLVPNADGITADNRRVTRIMGDALGMERPMMDVVAGPGARLLARPAGMRNSFGGEQVLTPARDLADGMNLIDMAPRHPLTVYHIALRRHATITAGGLDFESFHPGAGFERHLSRNMLSLFLSYFPHIREPRHFGTLSHPRLPLVSSERLETA